MSSSSTAVVAPEEPRSQEDVRRRLLPYDLRENAALGALYPPGQYPHTRRCAILVPLFFSPQDGQIHVLLTQRASTLRSHASNVAFPGGAADPSDADDTHTALREAHEEVGLPPSDVTVIAHLPPTFVRMKNAVFPVVGFIPNNFHPVPNPDEVAQVFSVPLRRFLGGDVTFSTFTLHGRVFRIPHVTHQVRGEAPPIVIWGVTGSICIAVARAVLGPFKRYRMVLGEGEAGEEEDDNVFGDTVSLYHMLCKASGAASSRL